MSELLLSHKTRSQPVTVSTAAASSTAVLMNDAAGGMVMFSGLTATATLAALGSADGVTYAPVFNPDGSQATVTLTADAGAVPMPDAVFPLRFVKFVSTASLGDTSTVEIAVKS